MAVKDAPLPFQEMADNISGNVRRAFIGLYEEKQLSDNQDLHKKDFLELMDIIDKGFGLLMKQKGIRMNPLENYFATRSINSCDLKHPATDGSVTVSHEISINH